MWHWEQSNKTQVLFLFIYLFLYFYEKLRLHLLIVVTNNAWGFNSCNIGFFFLFFFFPSLVSRSFVSDFPEPISVLQWRCILKLAWKLFWSRDLGISIEYFSITHVPLMSSYSIKRIISKPTQKASIFFLNFALRIVSILFSSFLVDFLSIWTWNSYVSFKQLFAKIPLLYVCMIYRL